MILISESYQGIRPAPGYPSCPDHSIKEEMAKLLKVEEIGISLTENFSYVSCIQHMWILFLASRSELLQHWLILAKINLVIIKKGSSLQKIMQKKDLLLF